MADTGEVAVGVAGAAVAGAAAAGHCARPAADPAGPGRRADGPDSRAAGPRVALAPREVDVPACVASGVTNAVTAERLGLRVETVKGCPRSTMRKLGTRTRGEAVVAARRAGRPP